ncbi:MAG: tetratricopeptide repeat protein [Armatimonadota bacterium]|nr:tetratricopeptide repeat protein [Armatimonadota bacterium]
MRFTIAPNNGSKRLSTLLAALCFLLLLVACLCYWNGLLFPGSLHQADSVRAEGLRAMQSAQYPQASALLLKAYTADPNRLDILNDYCASLTLQGRYATALKTLQALLRQQPNNQQALVNMGSLYLAMSNPQDAIVPLKKAVKLDPNDAHAQNLIEKARALPHGSTPLTHENNSPRASKDEGLTDEGQGAHLQLAQLYASQRKFPLALEECNRLLARDPRNAEARRLRSHILTTISANLDKPASPPAPVQGPVAPGKSP